MEFKEVRAVYRGEGNAVFQHGWAYDMELCEHGNDVIFRAMGQPETTLPLAIFNRQWQVRSRRRAYSRWPSLLSLLKQLRDFTRAKGL